MVKRIPLLGRLPAPVQARFREIGRNARNLLGELRGFQDVCGSEVLFFDGLVADGITQSMLGELLAEVGIAQPDGTALPLGSISSALSRARKRAGAAAPTKPPSGTLLQSPAAPGTLLQSPAAPGSVLRRPLESGCVLPLPAEPGALGKPEHRRGKRTLPAASGRRPRALPKSGVTPRNPASTPPANAAETDSIASLANDPTAARNAQAAARLIQSRS
jgi:hypothetical protein